MSSKQIFLGATFFILGNNFYNKKYNFENVCIIGAMFFLNSFRFLKRKV